MTVVGRLGGVIRMSVSPPIHSIRMVLVAAAAAVAESNSKSAQGTSACVFGREAERVMESPWSRRRTLAHTLPVYSI